MKKFITALLMVTAATTMIISEAQAKRFGGGGTFGRTSPAAARQAPMAKQAAKPAAPAATPGAPAARPSMWKGILGGALLGLGLGALLSHMGIGAGMASIISTILMIAIFGFIIAFIYRLVVRKRAEAQPMAYAGYPNSYPSAYSGSSTPEIGSGIGSNSAYQQNSAAPYVPYGVPADFDIASFLRSAKTYFIRLQASWDRADVNDIREFTTPEMFAEMRMQLQERGASENFTDVVTLEAELLGMETSAIDQMASVQFFGTIRESANAPAVEFSEIWNLVRPLSGSGGWILAGIQNEGA